MKYVKIKSSKSMKPIGVGFYINVFNAGDLLIVVEENRDEIIASYAGSKYLFRSHDDVEIIIREVPTLVYDLWYKGLRTDHTFRTSDVPDIRTLGYDINEPHEFKIRMIIT